MIWKEITCKKRMQRNKIVLTMTCIIQVFLIFFVNVFMSVGMIGLLLSQNCILTEFAFFLSKTWKKPQKNREIVAV